MLFMVVWWLFINFSGSVDTNSNFLYGAALGILPIIGSFFGFLNSNKWGGTKSSMGKTLVFLSAGLLTWGVGTVVFAYYNIFLQVAVPYPSLADLFYIISWPLWSIGMIYLSRATGVKFQLSNLIGRLALFVIPIIIAGISYYLLIIVARGGPLDLSGGLLKTFFDLAYPIGDIVILTIALLIYGLSFNYLGGFFKWAIVVILFGFVLNYLGDFSFVYTVTKETYFVANWVDLVYTSAFFCLSIGVSLIDPNRFSLGTNNQNHV
ncbi:MAG: hypothetical protein HYV76_02055 [Candidatus Vogelbacteria bacterium]|nr:hypothetical protein [Candidatus Vogelbacteria bacterium]